MNKLPTFESDCIALDGLDSSIGYDSLASLKDGSNADFLPLNRNLRGLLTPYGRRAGKNVRWQQCIYL